MAPACQGHCPEGLSQAPFHRQHDLTFVPCSSPIGSPRDTADYVGSSGEVVSVGHYIYQGWQLAEVLFGLVAVNAQVL